MTQQFKPYERIVIAGAGAFGNEMASWITGGRPGAPNLVFIDDTQPHLQSISRYAPQPRDVVIIAIANPRGREKVLQLLEAREANVVGWASPLAIGNGEVNYKAGLVLPFALISCRTQIGPGLVINTHSSIGHDCQLGRCCTLASHVGVAGRVTVGDRVEFGTGAVVIPGITIGDDAYIGAGAVVVQDVPAGAKVFGNPGRVIGTTVA